MDFLNYVYKCTGVSLFQKARLFALAFLMILIAISAPPLAHAEYETWMKLKPIEGAPRRSPNIPHKPPYLINDFLNIAFSNVFGGAFTKTYWDKSSIWTRKDNYRVEIFPKEAWWDEYINYPNGLPNHNVIHKWTKDIAIGIDWPQREDGRLYTYNNQQLLEHEYERGRRQHYKSIIRNIPDWLPEIENITGLSVRFILPDQQSERTKDHADIRIVPLMPGEAINFFHYTPFPHGTALHNNPNFFEFYYAAAVPFTPKTKTQVYGYILPEKDNSIGMAVCKINPTLPDDLMQSLLSECLLRALGLPNLSGLTDRSLTGHWNKSHREEIKVRTDIKFLDHLTDKSRLFKQPTGYDKFLASVLYCPEVKSGMDKYEVMTALRKSECFSKLLDEHRKNKE